MKIPIFLGSKVDTSTSHTISIYPVNSYAKDGKMRSIAGIEHFSDTPFIDRGGYFYKSEYFSGHFRVLGRLFCEIGTDGTTTIITQRLYIDGDEPVKFAASVFNLAIVGGGKYYLYNPVDGLRVISESTTQQPLGEVLDITWQQQSFILLIHKPAIKQFQMQQTEPGKDELINSNRNSVDDSDPDRSVALESEHSYFILFNKRSITFWNFASTDPDKFSYQVALGKQIDGGLVGRDAKARVGNVWIILSNSVPGKEPNFYQLGSNLEAIAPIEIQNILKKYSETELETVRMESYQIDGIDMLIVHLPDDSLMFNAQTGLWITLKSKDDENKAINYRAVNPVRDERINAYIVGDLYKPILGRLDEKIGTEYSKTITQVLYTPYTIINARLRHLVIEGNYANWPDSDEPQLIIEATDSGIAYGQPLSIRLPKGRDYNQKVSKKGLGLIRGNIGFRLEVNTHYMVELDDHLYLNESADMQMKVIQ